MKKIIKSLGVSSLMLSILSFGFGGVLTAQAATFTAADVASHNSASDCWVIVNNNVYNLTSFIATHPGGASVIIAQCGKDGTASFNSGPHTATSLNAISSLLLGTLTTVTTTTPILTSVALTSSGTNLLIGSTLQLTAVPKDQNNIAFVGATTTFSSSNNSVATVSNTGLVTGVSNGNVTISATSTSGSVSVVGSIQMSIGTTTTLPGLLSAQDFGVVNYDTGMGIIKGYSAGFGLTGTTFSGAKSVVVQLFNGNTLLQTNTAILPKFNANITGVQFSSPFDVSGAFNYATDGYWTNVRANEYGQNVPATRVVATVTLANDKVVTAENTNLTGDPTTILSPTVPNQPGNGHGNDNEAIENEHNNSENVGQDENEQNDHHVSIAHNDRSSNNDHVNTDKRNTSDKNTSSKDNGQHNNGQRSNNHQEKDN